MQTPTQIPTQPLKQEQPDASRHQFYSQKRPKRQKGLLTLSKRWVARPLGNATPKQEQPDASRPHVYKAVRLCRWPFDSTT